MTLSALSYAIALAALLAAAAHFLDRALRSLGRPTRWVWLAAMAGGALGPFLPRLLPAARKAGEAAPAPPFSLEALYALAGSRAATATDAPGLLHLLGEALPSLWLGASLLLATALLVAGLRLWASGRRWPMRSVGGQPVLLSRELGPAVLGLLSPRIVLPAWALDLSDEEVRMVLLHEREHLRARDPAMLAAGLLAVLAQPLNPGLWWMLYRLRLAVEGDCDGRVLARGTPRKPYANLLLTVASRARGGFSLAPALSEGGRTSLERRLRMMQWNVREKRGRTVAGGLILGGFFLAMACETPAPPALAGDEEAASPDAEATFEAREMPAAGVVSPTGDSAHTEYIVGPDGSVARTEATEEAGDGEWIVGGDPGDPIVAREGTITEIGFNAAGKSGKTPLFIIDGVIISDPSIVDEIDVDMIERVEVIKGALAEGLYGEKAANGVIKIFTKRG